MLFYDSFMVALINCRQSSELKIRNTPCISQNYTGNRKLLIDSYLTKTVIIMISYLIDASFFVILASPKSFAVLRLFKKPAEFRQSRLH